MAGLAVAKVEEWPLGVDLRRVIEVVDRWRRGRVPLESIRLPGVVRLILGLHERDDAVHDERDHRRGDEESANRGYKIERFPTLAFGVGRDSSRHPVEAEEMHWE